MRILSAIASVILATQAVSPRVATVEGVVVRLANGDPVPVAGVELARIGSTTGTSAPSAVSTAEGKFIFKDVAPGEYRLAATHTGFVRSEYGQRGPNGRGLVITVTAGQELKDLRIALTETAAIYGRIYDRAGVPLANVQVQAFKSIYQNGRRVFSVVKGALTNDLGEYRLFWLPPGQYYVSATPLPGAMPEMLARPFGGGGIAMIPLTPAAGALIALPDDAGTIPFYFPGTIDAKSAGLIELRPADNRGGVDIRIAALSTRRIRGVVPNWPTTIALAGQTPRIQLNLRDATINPASDSSLPGAFADATTGAFEIRGVLPGAYTINASASLPAAGPGAPPAPSWFGRLPIDVWDTDIDGIRLALEPGVNIPARVSIEGQPADTPDMKRLRILLSTVAQASPREPGAFTFPAVPPGDHRLNISQLPLNGYVKSARSGNTDVLSDGIKIENQRSDPPEIQIIIGTNAAIVDGVAVNDRREPIPNITVAVVPEPSRRNRAEVYRNISTDASGRFRLSGLAPGDYKVFAWEDVAAGAWQDAEFIQLYEDRGTAIHVGEGSKETLQVTAIPPRR